VATSGGLATFDRSRFVAVSVPDNLPKDVLCLDVAPMTRCTGAGGRASTLL
jgi:hypothetical protein